MGSYFRRCCDDDSNVTNLSIHNLPRPPTTTVTDGSTSGKILVVQKVILDIHENAGNHYTDKYHLVNQITPQLIIRRGFPFKIKIQLNRKYDKEKDYLCLVFTVKDAQMASYAQGTMVLVPIEYESNSVMPSEGWKAKFLTENENWMTVEVQSAANSIVGEWILEVDSKLNPGFGEETLRYTVNDTIFILFNPWCKEDQVFLEDAEQRKEFILNDTGLIWRGTYNSLKPSAWSYAQFEERILEASCYLLKHGGILNVVSRSDPIKVSRHISAIVNSPDEGGVVEGKWMGSFSGGQHPTSWTGSKAILQKFYKSKRPVKYGQCWVFAGICTTVCRCLGIPCRTITNYSSAHDTHNSLTIDYFFDEEGNPVKELNRDSVWNYHVWNEVWMTRPDLGPERYNGWQVIDATPQEASDGEYRCGPASVHAVKQGEILKTFDTTFVFAEVNADKVYWRYYGPNKPLKLIYTHTDEIGQLICTKAVNEFSIEDITDQYKHRERTDEEREVMLRALKLKKDVFSRYYLNDEFEDVEFNFILIDDVLIGYPFSVRLKAKNKNVEKSHTINAVLRVDTVLYTGSIKKQLKKENYKFVLKPLQETEIMLKVSYSEYEKAIDDQAAFNIAAMATVAETNFDYFAQDDFRVRMPDIIIETEGDLVVNKEFTVHAYFKNPLPKELNKCFFLLEGPGLTQPLPMKLKEPVSAGAEARVKTTMTPKSAGEKTIVAKFTSKELKDVDGFKTIVVNEK